MGKEIGLKKYASTLSSQEAAAQKASRSGLKPRLHTFDSLKVRDYRWLWIGMLGSFSAMQMQLLARGWLVVDTLEGSALDLGLVASCFGFPALVFSLFGGVVTDRVQKRNLLIFTQGSIALITLVIAILIVTGVVEMWHIVVSSLLTGTIFSFNMPGRQSLISELVGQENLSNAVALSSAG